MSAHSQSTKPVDLVRSGAGMILRLNAAAWRLVPGPGKSVAGALDLLAEVIAPEHDDRIAPQPSETRQAAPATQAVPPPAPAGPVEDEPPSTPLITEAERRRARRVPVKDAELDRAAAARIRAQRRETEDDPPDVVLTAGPNAEPGPEIRVAEPWEGYDEMSAAEIARRVREAPTALAGIVELYERQHGRRATVLTAAEKAQRRNGDRTA
jgi:type IV secretory pathway VirB10-like protein